MRANCVLTCGGLQDGRLGMEKAELFSASGLSPGSDGRLLAILKMKRFEEDDAGLFLSPFAKRSWLDAYRGVRLAVGGNRDDVVAFVQARVARAGRR